MLGRNKKASKKVKENAVSSKSQKTGLSKDEAATRIQRMIRKFLARCRVKALTRKIWVRVFDPSYQKYFWYDSLHGVSTWKQPKHVELFTSVDLASVAIIQRYVRGFVGRCRARKLANQKYTRYFDMETNRFYWCDNTTQKTFYNASNWLQKQNINMPQEDQLLLQSQMKIRELERKLAEKENEIKQIRKKRYEELEPDIIRSKVSAAKHVLRSKNMDEWTIDELSAWFIELKMDEYIPILYQNKVDGALFINLTDDEIPDLGISNKFHLRKLQLILKSYRTRYRLKKERLAQKRGDDDEDDLISEIAPSELSALIAAEDEENDYMSEGEESYENASLASEADEEIKLSEEQQQLRRLDEKNISIQMVMQGDSENFPIVGDIVRVKYNCMLLDTNKVVMSTKNILERPWVEFVLGIDQVIKGFERALPLMSVGERSKIVMSPEYAYGKEGLPPHIPPNASVIFDITLLGLRPRSNWVKPLIQDTTTNEKPYYKDMKVSMELSAESNILKSVGDIFSTSLILNEDPFVMSINGFKSLNPGSPTKR